MTYLWIFLGSYLLVSVCIFVWAKSQNAVAANRLRELGAGDRHIESFHKQASPLPHIVRPTIFFGTIIGGIASLLYWAVIA